MKVKQIKLKRGLKKGLNSKNICVSFYISFWWVKKGGGEGYILMIIKNARYNILLLGLKGLT
ncbi:hypothetical protein A8118_06565 [Campylobacter jejuni]|nr:hypothetical protein A8118_06565 [Campylobacter jejuni]